MRYITLDTGKKGAMVLFENGEPLAALGFKSLGMGIDSYDIESKLLDWEPDVAFIELITARPGQSAKATFTQGYVCGQTHSIVQLATVPRIEYIHPQTWTSFTKRLSATPERTSKQIAQELTERFYSNFAAPYKSKRGHKLYHDGIADCLCINMYVQRDKFLDFLT